MSLLRNNLQNFNINKTKKIISKLFTRATVTTSLSGNKTALYDFHILKNGKLINFCNYLLPIKYTDFEIIPSHLHTRKYASLFDVSHMLQTIITGPDSLECLENICTADLKQLKMNSSVLTVLTNSNGKILDDLIITKLTSEHFVCVSNASMIEQDQKIMLKSVEQIKSKGKNVEIEFLTPNERSLIALQGPTSSLALQNLIKPNLNDLYFMQTIERNIGGIANCRITRCGYTGEDGFEISMPAKNSIEIVEKILSHPDANVKLAGLGVRDSLRLEAGLCLYGNDIDSTVTPIEANLGWLIAKRRRIELNFPGSTIIDEQLKNGVEKSRIGFRMLNSSPPARKSIEIYSINDKNQKIGYVTSGLPSPCLNYNIGMGYINKNSKNDKLINLKIREKFYEAELCKMPFLKTNYYINKLK